MIKHVYSLQENLGIKTQFKAQLRVKQPRFYMIQFEIWPRWDLKCRDFFTHFQDSRYPANPSVQPQNIFLNHLLALPEHIIMGYHVIVPSKDKHFMCLALKSVTTDYTFEDINEKNPPLL